uniref:Family with sequence similarity 98 member B n=1 Tax=Pygocentrus nattereri TaxID=42514 RepID=A0AAR2IL12_PYGNA
MESDILDGLDQVGYNGALDKEKALLTACEEGFSSQEYVALCRWLATKLDQLCDLESEKPDTSEDVKTEMLYLGKLFGELACPYKGLVSGLMEGELKNKKDHLKIILFLVSELQAAQIVASKTRTDTKFKKQITPLQDLQMICKALKLPEPSQQQTSELFPSIENQVNILLKKVPEKHIGKPVLRHSLSSEQWSQLDKINCVLSADYECRRRMLIKRLDVTVQSFSWSDRAKAGSATYIHDYSASSLYAVNLICSFSMFLFSKVSLNHFAMNANVFFFFSSSFFFFLNQAKIDTMAKAYQPKRHSLTLKSSVSLAHLLATREDICNMVKTSSGASREKTVCAVNKVLMGRVPDRGGRPSEIEAPPPEMPPWQKRQDGGGYRGGGGGYGGGGYRGGGHGGGGYGGGGGGGYGQGGYGGGSKGGWGRGGGERDHWGKGGKGGYYR